MTENNPWAEVHAEMKRLNRFLPKSFENKHFDNFQVKAGSQLENIVEVFKRRSVDDVLGIWLSGQSGSGKTHLMLSLFNILSWTLFHTKRAHELKWYNYTDLCGMLRAEPNNFDLLCRIRETGFLFIDDVGTSKTSDFVQEKIYSIVNFRCENELPLFVTTNLNNMEMKQEFTERMTSRIKESAAWIQLNETQDFRSQIYLKNMEQYKHLTKKD
jgi:DNA replication protein DnaC